MLDATPAPVNEVHSPKDLDAVVLGSAIYAGHWRLKDEFSPGSRGSRFSWAERPYPKIQSVPRMV